MRYLIAISILLYFCGAVAGEDPATAVARLEDGVLIFSYPARDGVFGNERGLRLRLEERDGESVYMKGHWCEDDETWNGDVVAACRVRDGRVRKLEFTVLSERCARPASDRDLGAITAAVAAGFCLDLAGDAPSDLAEAALLGAVVACDVEIARPVIDLARNRSRPQEVREQAVFWLAVLAGEQAVDTLHGMIDDDSEDVELRAHAVFALTQLDEERGFPLLMNVARDHPHPEVRRSAFIWLAQYDRPEVVNLLEEILVGN